MNDFVHELRLIIPGDYPVPDGEEPDQVWTLRLNAGGKNYEVGFATRPRMKDIAAVVRDIALVVEKRVAERSGGDEAKREF